MILLMLYLFGLDSSQQTPTLIGDDFERSSFYKIIMSAKFDSYVIVGGPSC